MFRCPSVSPSTISNIFSQAAWPIKAKICVEHPCLGGTKVCSRHLGHMTKMAGTPIYGKKLTTRQKYWTIDFLYVQGQLAPVSCQIWLKYSSKLLCMSVLPARITIHSKKKTLRWPHHTLIFRSSRAANCVSSDGIWPNLQLIQDFMHALVTCKNEEDLIKNEVARVATKLLPFLVHGDLPDVQGQGTLQHGIRSVRISSSSETL